MTCVLLGPVLAGCADDPSDLRVTADTAPTAAESAEAPEHDDPGDRTEAAAPAEPVAPGEPVLVQALDNTFRADEVTVTAGTEVRWKNVGRNDHDVRPADGAPWGVDAEDFAPGDEYTHVFEVAGTYEYVCTIHGVPGVGMIGTVVVTG